MANDYQAQLIARANAQRAADRPKKIAIIAGGLGVGGLLGIAVIPGLIGLGVGAALGYAAVTNAYRFIGGGH